MDTQTKASVLVEARALTKAQIWQALPEAQRNSEPLKADIAAADPQLATSIYKDCFWKFDEGSGKMLRLKAERDLLPLLVGLYLQKGGRKPEAELEMWARIFQIELEP